MMASRPIFQDYILLQADRPPPATPGPELSDPRHGGGDPERGAGDPGPDNGQLHRQDQEVNILSFSQGEKQRGSLEDRFNTAYHRMAGRLSVVTCLSLPWRVSFRSAHELADNCGDGVKFYIK